MSKNTSEYISICRNYLKKVIKIKTKQTLNFGANKETQAFDHKTTYFREFAKTRMTH